MARVIYPKVLTSMAVGPWGTFSMRNVPLASVVAHSSRFNTLTMAYERGYMVWSSSTRPDTLYRPSLAVADTDIIHISNNVIAFLIT